MKALSAALLGQLAARIDGVFGAQPIAQAIPQRKAIVFLDPAAAALEGAAVDESAAQRAADAIRRAQAKAARGEVPTAEELPTKEELLALEVCIRFMRPALYVQDDRIAQGGRLGLTDVQRKRIEASLSGVGSIGFPEERRGIATGFLVGRRLLATNRHVVKQITQVLQRPVDEAVVRFHVEWERLDGTAPVRIARVAEEHPTLDWVLLELASDAPRDGLPLARAARPKVNDRILVVGHPLDDTRTPAWAKAMYAKNWGVKRASPGAVTRADDEEIGHDASTLGGNSGSPVFDVDSGAVIGVHAGGAFAIENTAVPSAAGAAAPKMAGVIQSWV